MASLSATARPLCAKSVPFRCSGRASGRTARRLLCRADKGPGGEPVVSEDVLARLRAAEEEAKKLKAELAAAQAQAAVSGKVQGLKCAAASSPGRRGSCRRRCRPRPPAAASNAHNPAACVSPCRPLRAPSPSRPRLPPSASTAATCGVVRGWHGMAGVLERPHVCGVSRRRHSSAANVPSAASAARPLQRRCSAAWRASSATG